MSEVTFTEQIKSHRVSWACTMCRKSGSVEIDADHNGRDEVARRVADDHQKHSDLCSATCGTFHNWSSIRILTARNGQPRWWRLERNPADGKQQIVFLTCKFPDPRTGVWREETEDELAADLRSKPWPPWLPEH